MAGRDDRDICLALNDPPRDTRWPRFAPAQDRQVDLPLEQLRHGLMSVSGAAQGEVDAGVLLAHLPCEATDELMRGRSGEADLDTASLAAFRGRDCALCDLTRLQDVPGSRQQHLPRVRQSHGPGCAVEESSTHVPLEALDEPAQRRLGDVKPRGGPAEVQLLCDRHECAQLRDLHDPNDDGSVSIRSGWVLDLRPARLDSGPVSIDSIDDDVFQQILEQTRDFVRRRVVPRENEILETDAVPDDIRHQAAELGLFGYAIPEEWGGLGLTMRHDVELAMEFGYTSLALRSMFGTNNGIAGQVLVNFGTDEQKKEWLPRIASGEATASFALTEPGAGSNPAGLRTKARREGDEFVISGQKRFITNAPVAGLFVVFARTRPADDSGPGIAVLLVPASTPGITVGPKDKKMGQEGAWTADVAFDEVRVPATALVGGSEDVGYRAAMTSLARGRIHIAALAVGSAQRALDESVSYAASATQGGTPIGDFQLVQAMLADQQTGVLAGRSLVREAARLWDSGEDRRTAPSVAKLYCTEMVGNVADLAVQIHGGTGYMREVPVERIYRDVRLLRLYEGTSEIQRLIIGGNLVRTARAQLSHP